MLKRFRRKIGKCYTNVLRGVDKMAKAMSGHCGGDNGGSGHCS